MKVKDIKEQDDKKYYADQLKGLDGDIRVKFFSEKGDTKFMNVNADSAAAIIEYLKKVK